MRRPRARPRVPRAVVLARPLQSLEVAALQGRGPRTSPCPTDSRSARPLHHLEGCPSPRTRTSPCSTGSRSRAPTSTSPEVAALRRERARPPCPTGSRSRAPTSEVSRWPFAAASRTSLVPRAAVLARPLQNLEVAALRRSHASTCSTGKSPRGAAPSTLEISNPRSGSAQETLVGQSTSSAQTLERSHVSAFDGIVLTELLYLPPGRVHRVAHAFAHRAKHREVRGVGKVFLNNRDGDIEGKAREGDAHLRIEVPFTLARARLDAAWRDRRPSRLLTRAPRASLFVPRPRSQIRKRGRGFSFSFGPSRVFSPLTTRRDASVETNPEVW